MRNLVLILLFVTTLSCNNKTNNPLQNRIDSVIQSVSGDLEPKIISINNLSEREVSLSFMINGSDLKESNRILSRPVSIVENENFYYVLDRAQHTIFKFDKKLNYRGEFGREGRGPAEFMTPTDLVTDGNHFYIYDTQNLRVQVLDREFNYLHSFEGQPIPNGKNLSNNNRLLFVLDRSRNKEKILDVYDISTLDKIYELMPIIMQPGEQPLALNRIEFSSNAQGYLVVGYQALPYIFIYNEMQELQQVLHFGIMESKEKPDNGESVFIQLEDGKESIISAGNVAVPQMIVSLLIDNQNNIFWHIGSNIVYVIEQKNGRYAVNEKIRVELPYDDTIGMRFHLLDEFLCGVAFEMSDVLCYDLNDFYYSTM